MDLIDGRIVLSYQSDIFFFDVKDILYFERLRNWTILHTEENEYYTRKSLKSIEELLNSNQLPFARVHKSFIVNLKKISKLKSLNTHLYEVMYTDIKVAVATKKSIKTVYKI